MKEVLEFRKRNDTQVDPEHPERPYSQRQLIECMRVGAERFGWDKRSPQPGKIRDGRWLVGLGAAAAFRNNLLTKSGARVRLDRSGVVTVETDMTDIGYRHLHDHRPDRRRNDGLAARQDHRAPRRFLVPGFPPARADNGAPIIDLGRLRGLHQAARGGGPETRLQFR